MTFTILSRDPFTGRRIKKLEPLVICIAVRGLRRVRVVRIVLRVAWVGGRILERDVVNAINIGLRYLTSSGSLMALGSTDTHETRVKLMNPHQGPTPQICLKPPTATYRH